MEIIYEDNHLIAVNKPAGWLVQGDKTGDQPLSDRVKKYIKKKYNKPGDVFLGVIHRIDRPVSGAVVFARTSKALIRMNKLFQDRAVKKTYMAIITQRPDDLSGHLTHYLIKDRTTNIAKAFDKPSKRNKNAKKSELTYDTAGQLGEHRLLKIHPLTGRPHQIRVQLAKMGWPIRGDIKYGFKRPNDDASISLHCQSLEFIHPVKKEPILIKAAFPDEQMWNIFRHAQE